MKNKQQEFKRKLHKLEGGRQHPYRKGDYYLPHCYEHSTSSLTYWSDFYFWLNGTRYSVTFTHPRCDYEDKVKEIVDNLVPFPKECSLFGSAVPSYKKVGNSRKKVAYYTSINQADRDALYTEYIIQHKLTYVSVANNEENNITVQPSVSVKWWNRSKNIDICVPYEVRTEEEALFLVGMIKGLYKEGKLFEWVAKMKNVVYNATSYIEEQEKENADS